jgi:hypothetical protein
MIITVIAMGMMQTTIAEVIHMIAMWHELVPTSLMATGTSNRLARLRVDLADRNHMLIVVASMLSMQMSIVEVIDMIAMLNANMPTMLAVLVSVILMLCATHGQFLSINI